MSADVVGVIGRLTSGERGALVAAEPRVPLDEDVGEHAAPGLGDDGLIQADSGRDCPVRTQSSAPRDLYI